METCILCTSSANKRNRCLRALKVLTRLATAQVDADALLYGDTWDYILQCGRLTGKIDLDWFTKHGFGVDKINTDKLPTDQPFLGRARNNYPSATLVRTTSEAPYDGELVANLWFANHSKSLVVAVITFNDTVRCTVKGVITVPGGIGPQRLTLKNTGESDINGHAQSKPGLDSSGIVKRLSNVIHCREGDECRLWRREWCRWTMVYGYVFSLC